MLPTIKVGGVCIVDQYSSFEVKRFDIVMLNAPEDVIKLANEKNVKIIKRVLGMPNDKLKIIDNKIYINGVLLNEPFEKIADDERNPKKNYSEIVIPANNYFLMGDNRPNSFDSRYWKKPTVSQEDILGKVIEPCQ